MKPAIIVCLTCLLFFSCQSNLTHEHAEEHPALSETEPESDKEDTAAPKTIEVLEPEEVTWRQSVDSIRAILFGQKPNLALKNSPLQELYLRNLVREEEGSLVFDIPFDLHDLGGMAPDCYTTQISFLIPFEKKKVEFPSTMPFELREHGCVDEEYQASGMLNLVEQKEQYVVYHSADHMLTVIFGKTNRYKGFPFEQPENVDEIWCMSGVDIEKIKAINLDLPWAELEFSEDSDLLPIRSTAVQRLEYDAFLLEN